jgi:hypothetical protein
MAPTPSLADSLQPCIGLHIRDVQVLGVNTLKTTAPQVADLIGLEILGYELDGGAEFRLDASPIAIHVDLQRVGVLTWLSQADRWAPGSGASPTVRILFAEGCALDLREPSKTKRITLKLFTHM